MKRYEKPQITITALNNTETVLLASGGINLKDTTIKKFNVIDTF